MESRSLWAWMRTIRQDEERREPTELNRTAIFENGRSRLGIEADEISLVLGIPHALADQSVYPIPMTAGVTLSDLPSVRARRSARENAAFGFASVFILNCNPFGRSRGSRHTRRSFAG